VLNLRYYRITPVLYCAFEYWKTAIFLEVKSSLVYTPHKQRGITRIELGSGLV
jgi:hypothetical protein